MAATDQKISTTTTLPPRSERVPVRPQKAHEHNANITTADCRHYRRSSVKCSEGRKEGEGGVCFLTYAEFVVFSPCVYHVQKKKMNLPRVGKGDKLHYNYIHESAVS